MTKATDLKTIFLKSPWKMDVETCVTLWYLFLHFFDLFWHFFQHSLHSKVIDLIFFFNELALKNIYIDPPAFKGLRDSSEWTTVEYKDDTQSSVYVVTANK